MPGSLWYGRSVAGVSTCASTTASTAGTSSPASSSSSLLSPSAEITLDVSTSSSIAQQKSSRSDAQLILSRIKSVRRPSAGDGDDDHVAPETDASRSPAAKHSTTDYQFVGKAKKKAPWGAMQLKDSWSIDAMSKKSDYDNMNERMHREYRYHPHELQRRVLKWVGLSVIPTFVFGMGLGYWYHTGGMLWNGDPQYILNFIRSADCSPRSKFYPFRIEGCDGLPEHIAAYREVQKRRAEAEKELKDRQQREADATLEAAIHRHRQKRDEELLSAAAETLEVVAAS
eukprot:CAMPEP_0176414342 /NCGR_PEP_ID=MMETSP0127-20121128/5208_1 /TAXON_ID=938130 /ORGANISM="Platyophrya macrostoma, Strain WH" /LENGTH=284 /DNA_ID=CAMNT_0017794237 /DNA_START=88 /DNA_END=942 /DNA_ORIENTATION=+